MGKKANQDIRAAVKQSGRNLWEVADFLGLQDTNFSKILRKELPEERKQQILMAIQELSRG